MASLLAVQKIKELSIGLTGSEDDKKEMLKKCAMTTLNSKLVSAKGVSHGLERT